MCSRVQAAAFPQERHTCFGGDDGSVFIALQCQEVVISTHDIRRVGTSSGGNNHVVVRITDNVGKRGELGHEKKRTLEELAKLDNIVIRVGIASAQVRTPKEHSFCFGNNLLGEKQLKNSSSGFAEEYGADTFLAEEGAHEHSGISDGGEHVPDGVV